MAWKKPAAYKRAGRLQSDHAAGAKAVRVFVCTNPACEVHHRAAAPVQCYCGGIEFIQFHSITEATHWAQLRLLEKRGEISALRRQVWFPLYAAGPSGQPIRVAFYVADFVYVRDGATVISDSKPRAGVDDLADLKLRWMAAMGLPVTIHTKGMTL